MTSYRQVIIISPSVIINFQYCYTTYTNGQHYDFQVSALQTNIGQHRISEGRQASFPIFLEHLLEKGVRKKDVTLPGSISIEPPGVCSPRG